MINGWILLIASWLLGGIPVGVLVAKAKGVDIMSVGSGNIGATNVARVMGKGAGLLVFVLDVLKGLVPAFWFQMIVERPIFGFGFPSQEFGLLCGGAAMAGHMASPFLKFKGGKGIATGLGMLVGSAPLVGVIALSSFIVVVAATRIVSLGSVVAAVVMALAGIFLTPPPLFWVVYGALGFFVVWKHRANMQRLLKGEEPKFSFARKDSAQDGGVEPSEQ
ncbi:acyl-phosphate glycerol 3-phosphate acyltransferase [bacterium]|jgi:acyl phosphate:glycerol-3-phosphate acyltransferase|nr:acyl-phosphate glycerol 3-phosphate acyltransferase [bacterium]